MNRPGWWELAVIAEKLGFRIDNLMRLVRRLRRVGLITSDESSSDGREIRHGRGDRRRLFYLSPSAVIIVASHARTPEAANFRRTALARLAEMPANALPAPVDHDELVALRRAYHEQSARFVELIVQVGTLSARIEELATRRPAQLLLPGVDPKRPHTSPPVRTAAGVDFSPVIEWLSNRKDDDQFTMFDLVDAGLPESLLDESVVRSLGLLFARYGWEACARVRLRGRHVRLYRRSAVVPH